MILGKMLIACIILCSTAYVVEAVDERNSEEFDFNNFIGKTLNFSYLTDNTKGVQLYLAKKLIDFSAFVVDDSNVNLLNTMLRGRNISEFLSVASKLAAVEAILAAKTGEKITSVNFEDMFNPESDSVLDADEVDEILREVNGQSDSSDSGQTDHSRTKRKAIAKSYKWSTTIPYVIRSADFVNNEKATDAIRGGIQNWEDETCLEFKQVDKFSGSHIIFKQDEGCWSRLGRQGPYGQTISIGKRCERIGIVAHEIGHALGLRHEHQRPDRDQYVTVNYNNVITGEKHNFQPRFWRNDQSFGIPYDYSSVMHYSVNAFSSNGENTLSVTDKESESLPGSQYVLSFYDVKIANYMYCADRCPAGLDWSDCQNGGYRDPKDCNSCRCPDGWTGSDCTQLEPAVNGNCGGELIPISTWSTLTSPNYGSTLRTLDKHLECTWKLKTSEENVGIVVRFTDTYRLPCTNYRGACKSYVEIKNQDMSKPGQRHCCYYKPRSNIISHGNEMMILLRLDARERSEAFKIEYRIESCGCSTNRSILSVPACLDTQTYSCPGTYRDCRHWPCVDRERENTCYKTERTCCGDFTLNGNTCSANSPWASWSEWGSCSTTCDAGTKSRTRRCSRPPCSGSTTETRPCIEKACPQKWGTWGQWTACSTTCDSGTKTRVRNCLSASCRGPNSETTSCNEKSCTGEWSNWNSWTSCSKTCGSGSSIRWRSCRRYPCIGQYTETRVCNTKECNGEWSNWNSWTSCSKTCGSGSSFRWRSCRRYPCSGGGGSTQTKTCNVKACKGEWSNWNSWTSCSKTCGSGSSIRWRTCSRYSCTGSATESKSCTSNLCPDQWNNWNQWTDCSVSCGLGSRSRVRTCRVSPCSGSSSQSRWCYDKLCPRNVWSTWSSWSSCSKTCGSGSRTRTRSCLDPPCSDSSLETQTCNTDSCHDSPWSSWTPWTACSRTCGTGFQMRSRKCSNQPCVGNRLQGKLCKESSCPTSLWSSWSEWGSCSKSCGTGSRSRTRTCTAGDCSGVSNDLQACNYGTCSS